MPEFIKNSLHFEWAEEFVNKTHALKRKIIKVYVPEEADVTAMLRLEHFNIFFPWFFLGLLFLPCIGWKEKKESLLSKILIITNREIIGVTDYKGPSSEARSKKDLLIVPLKNVTVDAILEEESFVKLKKFFSNYPQTLSCIWIKSFNSRILSGTSPKYLEEYEMFLMNDVKAFVRDIELIKKNCEVEYSHSSSYQSFNLIPDSLILNKEPL
jgi:hypothetical protein